MEREGGEGAEEEATHAVPSPPRVSRLVSAPDLTSGLNAQRWVDGLLPQLVSALSTGWSELSRGEIGGWCSLSAPVSGKNCARSDEDGETMGTGEGDVVTRPRVRSLLW